MIYLKRICSFFVWFFLRCKILYCIVRWGKTDKWMTQCSVLPSAKNSLVGLKQPPFALCPSLPNQSIDLATMLFDNARRQHLAVAYKTALFATLAKVNIRFAAVFEKCNHLWLSCVLKCDIPNSIAEENAMWWLLSALWHHTNWLIVYQSLWIFLDILPSAFIQNVEHLVNTTLV